MKSFDIHTLLPVGEKLKPLLNKSVVSESDMKNVLRKRGVFIGENDKKKIVPYLTMSLLSPKEFEELQDLQKTKEDALKFRNKSVKTNSSKNLSDLIETDLLDIEEFDEKIENCSFNTDIDFSASNPNKMIVEYEIIRNDITKDWANAESKYNGRVEIEKDTLKGDINLLSEYTSVETEEINSMIIDRIINELKQKNTIVENTDVYEIKSNDFTNEERFAFLLSLAKDSKNGLLKFKSVRNIEIGPDKSSNLIIAQPISLLDNSVKNIIINGEKGETLENIEYVKNKQYHQALILRAMQVEYSFNVVGASGTCIIEYGFPHFFRSYKKSKGFEVAINKLWVGRGSVSSNIISASRKVLTEFVDSYQTAYEKIKTDKDLGLSG